MFSALIVAIFGITAAILWGTADFLATKASRRSSPESTALWVAIMSTAAFALIYLCSPGSLAWSHTGILYAIAAGISLELGLYMLYRGLDLGPVSVVTPISSAYPIVTTIILILAFNASLSVSDIIGIIITLFGITIASGPLAIKSSERKISKGTIFGLAAFALWGVAYAFLSEAVPRIGWQKAALIDTATGLITLSIVLKFVMREKMIQLLKARAYRDIYVTGTTATQFFGGVIFTIGLAHTHSTAVLTTISACYPAITIILAIKQLGEKKMLSPLIGAGITICGIVVLTL